MDCYKVTVHGAGFHLVLDDEPGVYGFYVARFVKARDPDMAVQAALELLRRDPKLTGGNMALPRLTIDTVERLPDDFAFPSVQPGLALFREDGADHGAA